MSNGAALTYRNQPYLLGNNDNEQGYYALPDYRKNITVTLAEGDSFLLGSFTCPNQFEADARRAQNVPVWVYRYFGDWANVRLFPPNPAFAGQVLSDGSGAYHGAELEMVFGNPSGVSGIANTKAETQVIALIQGAWAAFARSPATGLSWYGWPKYNPATKSLIRLAYNNSVTPSFVSPSLYFAGCVNATSS